MEEVKIPIDFKGYAKEHGITRGKIFYSPTFKSWVIEGHPEISLILIDAPYKKGDTYNGKKVDNIVIKENSWRLTISQ